MSAPAGLELERPRDLGSLLSTGFSTYFAHFGTFIAIAAAVVVPVHLIVFGVGLEQLWSDYDSSPPIGETALTAGVTYLIITPLITAMAVHALQALGARRNPSAREAITGGLEMFTPVFLAVMLAALGVAVGLLLLILPGIYLAIRWYFVPQAVILERARGAQALERSAVLVKGSWWRVFAIGLVASLIAAAAVSALAIPAALLAEAADRAVIALLISLLTDSLTAPFVAIVGTLLYFDLRARRAGVPDPGAWPPPQPDAPPPPPAHPEAPEPPPAGEPPDPPGLPR